MVILSQIHVILSKAKDLSTANAGLGWLSEMLRLQLSMTTKNT